MLVGIVGKKDNIPGNRWTGRHCYEAWPTMGKESKKGSSETSSALGWMSKSLKGGVAEKVKRS